MSTPTVFLSAATVDLEEWRNLLDEAFREAGFHVLTQGKSLGMPPRDVRHMLVTRITESHCIIHLAGLGYGSHASEPFPEQPGFECSWTQFEYYYAHKIDKPVIAFVCAPDLSRSGFKEEGDDTERARKTALQEAHRERVKSGEFTGTPLAGTVRRTLNRAVDSVKELIKAVAGSVREVQGLGQAGATVADQLTIRSGLHQLPARPEGFVGREADLATLRAMPATGTVLTGLRGMGGIGKTALGLVLAHEWTAQFPDAQLFLDARGTQDKPPTGNDLIAQVIQSFHPTAKLPDDSAALQALYRQVLTGKRALIFLDNAKDAAQAKPLIPPPGCGFIITSRQSILLGTRKPYDVGKLLNAEATALLREYHPALTDAETAELVRLCAGLPLALRLAGAHLALDGEAPNVAAYVRALGSGRLKTLDADAADAGEITISETLRLSEAQLSEAERTAWRALGIFTASFDARAAQIIAGADEATLTTLVRRTLLEREGMDRYKLHDLAAEYACGQLTTDALTDFHLAHVRHFTAVAWEADALYKKKGEAVVGLALFDRERTQIEAAYSWLESRDDEADARRLIALAHAVVYTGDLRFHPRQRIAWLEYQLDAVRRIKDKRNECGVLGNLGLSHYDLGDVRKAIEIFEQGLEISRQIGERFEEGCALGNLGTAHHEWGDARKAIEYHEQALAKFREIGDRREEGNSLGNLGETHYALGDARKAIEFFEQGLVRHREIGDRRGEGQDLGNLGRAHAALGDAHKAVEYYEQGLVISREVGDPRGEGDVLFNSALAHDSLGNRVEAIARAKAALVIYEANESPYAAKVRAQLAEWK